MIGSMRTILHLSGCDELVAAIDDPACRLEDKIIAIPQGASPAGFITRHYAFADFVVPAGVRSHVVTRRVRKLYPNRRPGCFPASVRTVRLRWKKNCAMFKMVVDQVFDGALNKPGTFYRGLSLRALGRSMSFLMPVDPKATHEFGPGINTSEDFETACTYAGQNGAIMVFRDLDARDLEVWRPDHDEWNQMVARWLALDMEVRTAQMPAAYKRADMIVGPIPSGLEKARRTKSRPTQNREIMQTSFVSSWACRRLMASLWAIIYISR
jgi:hypothetical protein